MIKTNSELLLLFAENGRTKLLQAAKDLRTSSQRVKYYIDVFENKQLLIIPHAVIDYSFFGLLLFRVYAKGAYLTPQEKKDLCLKATKNPYVSSVYEMEGEYDICLELIAPNASRFNKMYQEIAAELEMLDFKVVMNVVSHVYSRSYLVTPESLLFKQRTELVIGGDRPVRNFSVQEIDAMIAVAKKPLSPMTRLAQHANMHHLTYKAVLKKLNEERIYRGVRFAINMQNLECEKARLFIKIHHITIEHDKKLLEFFLRTINIVQVHKTIGDWQYEIDIEALNRIDLRKTITDIREAFGKAVRGMSNADVYTFHKRRYLPDYLLEKEKIDDKK